MSGKQKLSNIKKKDLINTSQVLAILSGTWMMGSAMFAAQANAATNNNLMVQFLKSQISLFWAAGFFLTASLISLIIGLFILEK